MGESAEKNLAPLWDKKRTKKINDLHTLIEESSNLFGSKTYINPEEEVQNISFNELRDFTLKFSRFLENNAINHDEKIAVVAHNSTLMVLLFLSIISNRRIFVPINPNHSIDEIDYILSDSKPKAIIYDTRLEDKINELNINFKKIPVADLSIFIREIFSLSISDDTEESHLPCPDAAAEIVYTSGTTGNPKGVVLTHANLLADLYGVGEIFKFNSEERFLTVTPLFHNSGQIFTTLIPLWCGATTTAIRSDMGFISFWYYIDKYNTTWSLVMPAHVNLLLDREQTPQKHTLKGLLCGGAMLERERQITFEKKFKVPIYNNYGLTESTSIASCVRPEQKNRESLGVGKPVCINKINIYDGRKKAGANEAGEIRIKGPNIFKEYLNKPDFTKKKVVRGWLKTGDIGRFDDEGNLYILDRIDNMILVGGENVYPFEIEKLLPELSGLSECILTSIKHKILGSELVLVYKLKQKASADEKRWKNTFYKKLSKFKVPTIFINITDLGMSDFPRSSNGKILRKKLKDLVESHQLDKKEQK